MAGPLILHIETATDICSVALSEGDRQLSLDREWPGALSCNPAQCIYQERI